ncbi:SPRY domain-containing SOCS box protein 3 isoform X3 [Pieris rapae]|uniref:SPRY domain-containing SOCS box protein 3 isoform X3 n=1 Tax=Pieris rapae TaxID=64459 RepID=UPI001E2814F7|nr:SPRY domain-containing SOCS box protein 3 isoform X3 [Pieris rapae]
MSEWKWEQPTESGTSWVVLSEDKKQVTFHPFYSSGTAAAKGDTPLLLNQHYYWEIKILTDTYGTDIMVGVGTNKVIPTNVQFKFTSLLGQDSESYGLSYTGAIRHNAMISKVSVGFCKGSIVGVRVDMWRGTLQFFLNRKAQGISFYNLRRHKALYPIICSTAAQSSMRLIYAASWRASLLVDSAKILGASIKRETIPPGLRYMVGSQFWLTLPTGDGSDISDDDEPSPVEKGQVKWEPNVLDDILPSPYVNGFYVDNVERNYRVVVWE